MVLQPEFSWSPAGRLRCDVCADIKPVKQVRNCEECGNLFCESCASPYPGQGYSYCMHCVSTDQGDTEEDPERWVG